MAKLYADQEIRVAHQGHVISITAEPKEVPEFLVGVAMASGAKKATAAPKRTSRKPVQKGEAE